MEVFKRDSFKCVYCGRTAESDGVILVIDHIKPVDKGGENDIYNLVTACFDCNAGKGKRELSDKSVIEKQRKELEMLNVRHNQLQELKQWRDELAKLDECEIDYFNNELKRLYNHSLTEIGRKNVKRMIKKHTLQKCIGMMSKLYEEGKDSDDIVNYIEKCLKMQNVFNEKPYLKEVFYIRKILLNRFDVNNHQKHELLKAIEDNWLDGCKKEWLINCAKECNSIWQFLKWMSED